MNGKHVYMTDEQFEWFKRQELLRTEMQRSSVSRMEELMNMQIAAMKPALSRRDVFACEAMSGILSSPGFNGDIAGTVRDAFLVADMMEPYHE